MCDDSGEFDKLGPGTAKRHVSVALQFPGMKKFYLNGPGEFTVYGDVSPAKIKDDHEAEVMKFVASFFAVCFPEGQITPDVLQWEFGSLIWVPDDSEWRRHR